MKWKRVRVYQHFEKDRDKCLQSDLYRRLEYASADKLWDVNPIIDVCMDGTDIKMVEEEFCGIEDAVLPAVRRLLRMATLDEVEDRDSPLALPEGKDAGWVAGSARDIDLVKIVYRWIGMIDQAWGQSVELVFHWMALTADEKADALYYLLMNCMGHGVGLDDDYSDRLDLARDTLGKPFEAAPVHFEGTELRELAEHFLVQR